MFSFSNNVAELLNEKFLKLRYYRAFNVMTSYKYSSRDRNMCSQNFIQDCKNNNLKVLKKCLSRGVDVNTTQESDGKQVSALMVACEAGNSAIVSRLVEVPGLDINYETAEGGDISRLCPHYS